MKSAVSFSPLKLGSLTVAGRIYKTATAETRADANGYVTDALLDFYRPMVEAGTPLIITGNVYVSRQGKSSPFQTGTDHDDKIPGLRRLADLAHTGDTKLFAQLNHCGRQVMPKAMGLSSAVSASNVQEKMMGTTPRPMTVVEIEQTVQDFVESAVRCQKAGFDGVQIHAGHGYLISQFLTPYTNRRTDQYGGSFEKRSRVLCDVYAGIREKCGKDFTIIMKLNGHDSLPGRQGLETAELLRIALMMQDLGLDGVEITCGHYESGFPMIKGTFDDVIPTMLNDGIGSGLPLSRRLPMRLFGRTLGMVFNQLWPHSEGFNLKYAQQFSKALDIPVICVGGFQTQAEIDSAIDTGSCDAVSVARAMVADPLLVHHLKTGQEGPGCTFCNGCIARAGKRPVDCYDDAVKLQQLESISRFEADSRSSRVRVAS